MPLDTHLAKLRTSILYRITLKALANSSPGFALKPWVKRPAVDLFATLKKLRRVSVSATFDATLSGLRKLYCRVFHLAAVAITRFINSRKLGAISATFLKR